MKSLIRFQFSSFAIFFVFLFFIRNYEAKAQLKASFTFSPQAGCRAITVSFTNTSTGSIAKYSWNFGNGNTSTIQNPGASYNNQGKYTVSLTVYDSKGDSSTSVQTDAIIVYNPPSPEFKVNDSSLCSPGQVSFTDLTKGAAPISKWDWDFGDGSTASTQNPSHTYTNYGKFTVTLVLTDIYGCSGTLTKTGYISIGTSLAVSFSGDTRNACMVPATVNFTSNVSGASGNVSYKWNFGDGNSSTTANPSHAYSSFGDYSVSLSVTDNQGCTITDNQSGYIDIAKITSGFSASSTKGCVPASISFTPVSSSICPSCLNYWNFGDGSNTSSQSGAAHTYTAPGTYSVSQKVVSIGEGCSDSIEKNSYITINPVPHDSFYARNNIACKTPLKVYFTGSVSGSNSYKWDFGDGNTNSSSLTPTHTYNRDGIFTISLTATNAQGCSYVYSDTSVRIIEPVPTITTIKGNKGCLPDSVQFRGIFPPGYAKANSWLWNFGDSAPTSTDSTPVHVYTRVGWYTVTLKMSDIDSCTGTTIYQLSAGRHPAATFKAYPTKQCAGEKINFHIYPNLDSVQATTYYFNFGDGLTNSIPGNDTTTFHIYAIPGTYSVSLTAYDYSCGDSFSIKNYITIEPPSAGFVYLNAGCNPQIVSFFDSSVGATSYTWNFGDGTSSTEENPIHRYKNPGTYFVLQTVSNSKTRCSASSSQPVQIDSGGAAFSTSVAGNCQSKTYTFSAILAPGQDSATYSFSWSLGDNSTSNKKTVSHTYANTGQYTVRLITNDNQGCIDTITKKINVGNKVIQALFSASETFAKCPQPTPITFYDTSVSYGSPIVSWKWYFSNGATSTIENPQQIFSYPGSYNVALAIVSALGCTDSIMKKGFIVIKGPYGAYTDNVQNGCDSAVVTFTVTNTDADTLTWDMTDGYILYGAKVTHTFYDTKRYWAPTLRLTDSGCTYPLYPKDTVAVYPAPAAAFGYDTTCNGKITILLDSSSVQGDIITNWDWDFGDGDSSTSANPVHLYIKSGNYKGKLTVTTSHGCSSTIKKNIVVKELTPGFTTSTNKLCVLDTVQFLDTTLSDLPIAFHLWDFGDNVTSTQTNPKHKYAVPGYYNVREIVSNRLCLDTVTKNSFLSVGDTNTPAPLQIHHVSALTDGQIGLCFYGFLNPSFAEYIILKYNATTGKYEQIAIDTIVTDTIYYDKNVDVNDTSYCYKVLVKTSCDKISGQYFTREHCSIKLVTANDTDAVSLNWTPYIGWGGVAYYNVIRCRPGDSVNYCQIATVGGSQLQFYDSTAICAGRYHYIVSATSPALTDTSRSNVAIGTPIHVNRVPAVSLIVATVSDNSKVLLQWQSLANIKVANYLVERSGNGNKYEVRTSLPPDSLSFTDDSAQVQKQSYYYIVRAMDSCGDIGKPSNVGRTIFLQIDTSNFDMSPKLVWNAYVFWPQGVNYYTVLQENPKGGFKILDNVMDTTYTDTATNLDSLPYYCYEIVAHRNMPANPTGQNDTVSSVSNIGCLHEEKSVLYIPNAFTPNGDGLNDRFGPKGLYITQFNMKIYNRWGQLVFSGNSFFDTWDGTFGGKPCEAGTYIWTASVLGLDNNLRFLYGNVSLLK